MDYNISTPMQLAHTLRDVRKSRKLSQDAAGKLVGLLPKTISGLENHPEAASVDSLLKLLSALDLELIVSRKDKAEKKEPRSSKTNGDW
jgi:HTH-type transcriptional regulator/antitoxin HipB